MRHIKILAVMAGVLGCMLVPMDGAQAGDVYKYIDSQGKTMYTDKPIPGAVLVSSANPRPAETATRSYAAQQAATTQQLAASNQRIAENQTNTSAAAAVARDLAASQSDRCKQARETYEKRINSQRLYRTGKDGEREYLNDAELSQARVDARREMDSICASG
jgi:hypothetical protein